MSAYVIAQIRWDDQEEIKRYVEAFYPVFERHGGTVLAATEHQTEVIEGSWSLPDTVVMRFPSADHARRYSATDFTHTRTLCRLRVDSDNC